MGIELHTRRRNRVTGKITALRDDGFALKVDQSFGNCPQYIQARGPNSTFSLKTPVVQALGSRLDDRSANIITQCDTFFIASASPSAGADNPVEGVDVNHRGGRPGFVRVEVKDGRSVVTFPDFVGNLAFNTLGNIALNPRAGLLFVDFKSGDLVTLTRQAEVLWGGAELREFAGAERMVKVRVDEAYRLAEVLPWRWSAPEQAPEIQATGDWQAVAEAEQARSAARSDRRFRIARVQVESPTVRSFDLQPVDRGGLAGYEPGQFLPLAVSLPGASRPLRRTYSLSTVADGERYRISVRRDPEGVVSDFLHKADVGTEVLAQAPRGTFRLDPSSRRPVALIGAGIGITPLLAMAEFLTATKDERPRLSDRPVYLIHAVRNGADHPFKDHVRNLANSQGNSSCFSVYSAPRSNDRLGDDFQITGRLDRTGLRAVLPLDDYDAYLCGPAAFVQDIYAALVSLGISDDQIHSETFGPARLERAVPAAKDKVPLEPAVASAQVTLAASGKQVRWQPGMSLFDLVEASGIDAPWSCRSGNCGTCATRVTEGRVTYPATPSFPVEAGEALICRAQPASASVVLDI